MENLFLLRHGIAEDISIDGTDFSRKLTEEGILNTKRLSKLFNQLTDNIDIIISSPYLRAKETTELFASKLDTKPSIVYCDLLSVGASTNEVLQCINPYKTNKNILIVGHSPTLEIFVSNITGGSDIRMKKGALAKVSLLNLVQNNGQLEYLITSKIYKRFS